MGSSIVLTGDAIGFAEYSRFRRSQPFIKRKLLRNVADLARAVIWRGVDLRRPRRTTSPWWAQADRRCGSNVVFLAPLGTMSLIFAAPPEKCAKFGYAVREVAKSAEKGHRPPAYSLGKCRAGREVFRFASIAERSEL